MIKNKVKLFAILLMVVMITVSFSGCGKSNQKAEKEDNGYIEPLENYFDGIKNKNIEQVSKAFPDFVIEKISISSENIDDIYTRYEESYGANIKFEYSFGNPTVLDGDELSELVEEITEEYGIEKNDITAAQCVPISVKITGDGISNSESQEKNEDENNESTNSGVDQADYYVIKYKDNWYIL